MPVSNYCPKGHRFELSLGATTPNFCPACGVSLKVQASQPISRPKVTFQEPEPEEEEEEDQEDLTSLDIEIGDTSALSAFIRVPLTQLGPPEGDTGFEDRKRATSKNGRKTQMKSFWKQLGDKTRREVSE